MRPALALVTAFVLVPSAVAQSTSPLPSVNPAANPTNGV